MPNRYAYTGREYDGESGLYYYQARYYDAETGRFLSQDPAGLSAGDANLYRYVGNDPLNLTDPSGLQAAIKLIPDPGPIFANDNRRPGGNEEAALATAAVNNGLAVGRAGPAVARVLV